MFYHVMLDIKQPGEAAHTYNLSTQEAETRKIMDLRLAGAWAT